MYKDELLNEIVNAVEEFQKKAVMFSAELPDLAEACLDRILGLVELHHKHNKDMVEAVCQPERKITKIGIAVGSQFAPEDMIN